MDSATHTTLESARPVTYARQDVHRHGRRKAWMLIGALIVTAGIIGIVAMRSKTFGERIFGKTVADPGVYVVKPMDLSIVLKENGELKPRNSVEVKCELEGQSTILSVVAESTRVKKGELLVELASDTIKERLESEEIELSKIQSSLEAAEQSLLITQSENASNIKKCEIDLEIARLELKRYKEGDYQRSLKAAQIDIAQTKMNIDRLEDELRKKEELSDRGFVKLSDVRQAKFDLDKARMTLEQNELQLKILVEFEKPKNEKQKEAAVEQAGQELEREHARAASREKQAVAKVEEQRALLTVRTSRVERLRSQYAKCRIYAPVDGIVQYPADDGGWRSDTNRIAAGERAYEGQTLIVLPDTSQMLVTTRIHEADRHKVKEGMRCLVHVPAVPGRTFTGRITQIAKFADSANRWLNPELKEHTTEVLLDETDAPVSPGDSAEVRVLVEDVPNVLAVPVQCVFSRGLKSYVFLRDGSEAKPAEIALGRASTTMVEVTNGVNDGDEVLMHATDEQVASLPATKTNMNEPFPSEAPATPNASDQAAQADTAAGSTEAATQTSDATPATQPAANG